MSVKMSLMLIGCVYELENYAIGEINDSDAGRLCVQVRELREWR